MYTELKDNTDFKDSTVTKNSSELPKTSDYNKELIYNLFDSGDSMNISLVTKENKIYNTYIIEDRQYAEKYDSLMDRYYWSLINSDTATDSLSNLYTESLYYIILESKDKDKAFTFFADNNKVSYCSGEEVELYLLTYKYDENYCIAADMRNEYENQDASYAHIAFRHDGTIEDVVKFFIEEIFSKKLLNLAPGGMSNITNYQVVDYEIMDIGEDRNAYENQGKKRTKKAFA